MKVVTNKDEKKAEETVWKKCFVPLMIGNDTS